eukprot:gene21806-24727_t
MFQHEDIIAMPNTNAEVPQDGPKYLGETQDGLRWGRGECWDELGYYTGEWVSDVREGHGIQTCVNGAVYEGGFVDDRPCGQGKFT